MKINKRDEEGDEEWGEEVIAFVAPRDGAEVNTAELDQLCLENIARFGILKELVVFWRGAARARFPSNSQLWQPGLSPWRQG